MFTISEKVRFNCLDTEVMLIENDSSAGEVISRTNSDGLRPLLYMYIEFGSTRLPIVSRTKY